jgi:hypothetical protein
MSQIRLLAVYTPKGADTVHACRLGAQRGKTLCGREVGCSCASMFRSDSAYACKSCARVAASLEAPRG